MRLGILDAVPSRFLHIDGNISDAQKFIDLFSTVDLDAETLVYTVGDGQFPAGVGDCDAYLVSGSPLSVYDDEAWIEELIDFVRAAYSAGKKLVGICFGHQVIAQALGGHVDKSQGGWMLGLLEFQPLEHAPWMQPELASARLYHANKDQVIALPDNARRLAGSAVCENSIYVIGDQVLGIQGHPEQPLRALHNFIHALDGEIPPDVAARAKQSAQGGEPDAVAVAHWICNFLCQ